MERKKNIEPVPYLEIDRYLGVWYEIGRYSNWYENDTYNVSAEYIAKDSYIDVIYRHTKSKKERLAKGKLFIIPDSGNARFKSQFIWVFKQERWVIDLDEENQWLVASNPKQSQLWILYRKPTISNEVLRPIVYRLVNMGFDLAKVHWTKQEEKKQ